MTAVIKASFTTQAQAEHTYNTIARGSSDVYEVRLHGKVVTIECRDMSLAIHVANKEFQIVGGFIKKITIQEEAQ